MLTVTLGPVFIEEAACMEVENGLITPLMGLTFVFVRTLENCTYCFLDMLYFSTSLLC